MSLSWKSTKPCTPGKYPRKPWRTLSPRRMAMFVRSTKATILARHSRRPSLKFALRPKQEDTRGLYSLLGLC